jgi:CHAT domain-containing protein
MAILYQLVGDWKQAVSLLQQSLTIRERALGNEHPDTTRSLEFLARCFANQGNLSKSLFFFDETISRQRHHILGQLLTPAGERSEQPIEPLFAELDALYSLGSAATNNFPKAVRVAAQQSSLSKAFLEEVATTQSALETDANTSTHELRQQYTDVQAQLARLPDAKLDVTQRDTMRHDLQIELGQLEAKLAERVGLVAQTIRERNFTLADVARDIPTEAALVDFIQYQRYDFASKPNEWKESRYAAYLTFPLARDATNIVVERVDLGEAAPINEAVELVCKRMSAGQFAAKDLSPALQQLSDLVYAPLAPYLTNVSHLIVCPDGQLSRLPFEMLPVGNKFLVEEKTISYVTSGREIVRIASPKPSIHSSKSLVMGNPDFNLDLNVAQASQPAGSAGILARSHGDAKQDASQLAGKMPALLSSAATRSLSRSYRGMTFTPLPGSGVEATNVAKLLGSDAVLRLGPEAREAELKAVASPRVLHLATHGFFLSDQEFKHTNSGRADLLAGLDAQQRVPTTKNDWENPLVRCGIALAGANHAMQITNAIAEDGLLTGLEASLLNLQGTELVILSACDSGTGEVKIGEGVMSLRRAFRIAGAESVLASHWSVSDKATSRLMTEFMRRWRAGEPRAQAWREAQLELLHSKDFSNPYFWSAFTLTGQWN